MTTDKQQLVSWLNSAYAMEQSLMQVLENHADDARDFPEVRQRDLQHLEETRRHAKDVEECLSILGEKPSATKSVTGSVMGKVQGMSSGMYKDELVKNFLSDYAAEHFEIACYTSLAAAANELGFARIVELCESILEDERAMADWLEERIPLMTVQYLQEETSRA